ncbi:MAG: hypothetical protein RR011_01650 [Oscillospiraceae bacterium]
MGKNADFMGCGKCRERGGCGKTVGNGLDRSAFSIRFGMVKTIPYKVFEQNYKSARFGMVKTIPYKGFEQNYVIVAILRF